MRKRKFRAIFVLREKEVFHIVGKKRIKVSTERVRYRGGTYPVNLSFPTFTKKNRNYYFLNVKEIKQILMIENNNQRKRSLKNFGFEPEQLDNTDSQYDLLTPKELDLMVTQGWMRSLITSLTIATKTPILLIVICLIAGTGLGWVIRDIITGGYF